MFRFFFVVAAVDALYNSSLPGGWAIDMVDESYLNYTANGTICKHRDKHLAVYLDHPWVNNTYERFSLRDYIIHQPLKCTLCPLGTSTTVFSFDTYEKVGIVTCTPYGWHLTDIQTVISKRHIPGCHMTSHVTIAHKRAVVFFPPQKGILHLDYVVNGTCMWDSNSKGVVICTSESLLVYKCNYRLSSEVNGYAECLYNRTSNRWLWTFTVFKPCFWSGWVADRYPDLNFGIIDRPKKSVNRNYSIPVLPNKPIEKPVLLLPIYRTIPQACETLDTTECKCYTQNSHRDYRKLYERCTGINHQDICLKEIERVRKEEREKLLDCNNTILKDKIEGTALLKQCEDERTEYGFNKTRMDNQQQELNKDLKEFEKNTKDYLQKLNYLDGNRTLFIQWMYAENQSLIERIEQHKNQVKTELQVPVQIINDTTCRNRLLVEIETRSNCTIKLIQCTRKEKDVNTQTKEQEKIAKNLDDHWKQLNSNRTKFEREIESQKLELQLQLNQTRIEANKYRDKYRALSTNQTLVIESLHNSNQTLGENQKIRVELDKLTKDLITLNISLGIREQQLFSDQLSLNASKDSMKLWSNNLTRMETELFLRSMTVEEKNNASLKLLSIIDSKQACDLQIYNFTLLGGSNETLFNLTCATLNYAYILYAQKWQHLIQMVTHINKQRDQNQQIEKDLRVREKTLVEHNQMTRRILESSLNSTREEKVSYEKLKNEVERIKHDLWTNLTRQEAKEETLLKWEDHLNRDQVTVNSRTIHQQEREKYLAEKEVYLNNLDRDYSRRNHLFIGRERHILELDSMFAMRQKNIRMSEVNVSILYADLEIQKNREVQMRGGLELEYTRLRNDQQEAYNLRLALIEKERQVCIHEENVNNRIIGMQSIIDKYNIAQRELINLTAVIASRWNTLTQHNRDLHRRQEAFKIRELNVKGDKQIADWIVIDARREMQKAKDFHGVLISLSADLDKRDQTLRYLYSQHQVNNRKQEEKERYLNKQFDFIEHLQSNLSNQISMYNHEWLVLNNYRNFLIARYDALEHYAGRLEITREQYKELNVQLHRTKADAQGLIIAMRNEAHVAKEIRREISTVISTRNNMARLQSTINYLFDQLNILDADKANVLWNTNRMQGLMNTIDSSHKHLLMTYDILKDDLGIKIDNFKRDVNMVLIQDNKRQHQFNLAKNRSRNINEYCMGMTKHCNIDPRILTESIARYEEQIARVDFADALALKLYQHPEEGNRLEQVFRLPIADINTRTSVLAITETPPVERTYTSYYLIGVSLAVVLVIFVVLYNRRTKQR